MGYTILTEAEQKAMAFVPKAPALLSFISSICAIVFFIRHPEKRGKMYHRIVFTMSLYGALMSIMFMIGTAAFPVDTLNAYGASGTVASCVTQGLIAQFCHTIPLYYSSLSIYCYLAVRANFQEKKIVWIEKWIHGVINIFVFTSGITLAATNSLNPSGPICFIEPYPPNCGSDTNPCERSNPKQSEMLSLFLSAIPTYSGLLIAITMMIATYRAQLRKEDLNKLQRRKQLFETARRKKSKIIAIQASLYVMAFFVCFIMPVITRTSMMFGLPTNNLMRIIGAGMLPLQNFAFTVVYFGLQNSGGKEQKSQIDTSYCAELRKRLSDPNTSERSRKVDENILRRTMRKASYSIFDGSKLSSSPWRMFLYDEDDDDEEHGYLNFNKDGERKSAQFQSREESGVTDTDISVHQKDNADSNEPNDIETDQEDDASSKVQVIFEPKQDSS